MTPTTEVGERSRCSRFWKAPRTCVRADRSICESTFVAVGDIRYRKRVKLESAIDISRIANKGSSQRAERERVGERRKLKKGYMIRIGVFTGMVLVSVKFLKV